MYFRIDIGIYALIRVMRPPIRNAIYETFGLSAGALVN